MTFVYDLSINPDDDNNTHAFALRMIGHNKSVLEVGAATGYFTKVLAERGCKVVGMEIDPGAAKQAEAFADRVVVGDVDDESVWDFVDDEAFDVITFGDVLEHLKDPLATLRFAKRKLKPFGFIVTSLPNVSHGDVRLSLLHGSFQYRDTGLLDRTHIRFFTLETIRELLADAGFIIVETERVIMPLFQSELGVRPEQFPQSVIDEVRADPEAITYQYVMKSVIDNGSAAVSDMSDRLNAMSDRLHDAVAEGMLLKDKLVGHEDLKERYESILAETQRYADHIQELTAQVYHLHDELEEKSARTAELEGMVESLDARLAHSLLVSEDLVLQLDAIRNSRSYRLTVPLRRLTSLLAPPRGA